MTPLDGLKVVELARVLAGPWAGQTLADLGADVIKIESPAGDDTRQWGPPFVERDNDRSAAYFHSTNRGKRSIALDLRDPDDHAVAVELVRQADVLIENFKVGSLARLGFDFDAVQALNPRLIYCSITGFGQTGPYASRAGYDYIIQAMCGLMSVTGDPSGPPEKVGVAATDLFTGMYAATAILAALHQRDRTGKGQHIDLSLMDCGVALMANQSMNYLVSGTPPQRIGNKHPNLTPYQVFECADGLIVIATGNDTQYRRLCGLLGVPEMAEDPAFLTNADRIANRETMTRRLTEASKQMTKATLLAACEGDGVPAGPINHMDEVFADPQVIARGLSTDADGVPTVRSPMRFSGADLAENRSSPRLDEHGAKIRSDLKTS